jgi:hypothetical protein
LVLAAGLPVVIRQTGRAAWPAVPAMALLVAWLGVMLALPQLMQPETAPGPSGLALPAVQAYVPNYFPGAKPGSARPRSPQPPLPIPAVGVTGGGNELAAEFTSESGRSRAGSVVEDDGPTVTLEALPVVVTTAVPVAPLLVAAPPPSEDSKPREASKSKKDPTARKAQKPRQEAKPDRKSEPDEKRKRSKIVAA